MYSSRGGFHAIHLHCYLFENELNINRNTNMKNLVKNIIAIVLVVVSVGSATAKETPVKVIVAGEKSIELSLGEISGKVWISFKNDLGYVFYSKKVKDLSSYKVKYDLAAFPDGEYRLELNASTHTLNVPVTIENGTVTLKEELATAPVVSNKQNVVAVELSGETSNAWYVMIKNNDGELLFKETVENSSSATRKYDLSNLDKGIYTLHFSTAGNTFSHNVSVKN